MLVSCHHFYFVSNEAGSCFGALMCSGGSRGDAGSAAPSPGRTLVASEGEAGEQSELFLLPSDVGERQETFAFDFEARVEMGA